MIRLNWSYLALFAALLLLHSCARPVAVLNIEEQEVMKAPVTLNFQTDMTELDSVRWDFGDGNFYKKASVDHTFWMSGRYKVELTVWKGKRKAKKHTELIVNAPDKCLLRISTSQGDMVAELSDLTPEHRDNFLKLVDEKFYDSLIFHRVIDGFMIQGGDPNSRNADKRTRLGSGGPGYQIPAEIDPRLVHLKGAIAAARMGDQVNPEKKSSGSQFYIVQGNPVPAKTLDNYELQKGIQYSDEQRKIYEEMGGTPFLDMEYTVFGQIIEGLDVIDRIAAVQTDRGDRPVEDVKMSITLIH